MNLNEQHLKQFFNELELDIEDEIIVGLIVRHRARKNKHQSLQDLEKAMLHLKKRINDVKMDY